MTELSKNKDLILRENLALQRTDLANQRTFLSFLRTALYFAIAGLSLENVLQIKQYEIIEIVSFSIACLILIFGIINYFLNKKRINRSIKHIGNYQEEYES